MKDKGKADKRNRLIESGNWRPGEWTVTHTSRFCLHVHKRMLSECHQFLGGEDGIHLAQELHARDKDWKSAVELAKRGVKTLGGA
jgi:hypothetical protein